MQLGMIGLGRMGANIVRRLHARRARLRRVRPRSGARRAPRRRKARRSAGTIADLVQALEPPRAVWVMVPAGEATESTIRELAARARRPATPSSTAATRSGRTTSAARGELKAKGIHYLDVGTSGGVWGLERGYCLMLGGDEGRGRSARSDLRRAGAGPRRHSRDGGREGRDPRVEHGYLHAGPAARAISSR